LLGCGHQAQADDPDKDKPDQPHLVGRVASVPGEGGFVLIQSYGAWAVPEGETVFARGPDGRSANLLPTGEHLSQFVAADIRSGQVAVGDAVYTLSKGKAEAGSGQSAGTGGATAGKAATRPGTAVLNPIQNPQVRITPASGGGGGGTENLPALPER
jgi:hypothetical protein